MTRFLLLTLALMCENVNAAPQAHECELFPQGCPVSVPRADLNDKSRPAVAAPFTLAHPLCQTGFTIAQRLDTRNAAGAIIKSVWVRKCTKGKIIYGGKV